MKKKIIEQIFFLIIFYSTDNEKQQKNYDSCLISHLHVILIKMTLKGGLGGNGATLIVIPCIAPYPLSFVADVSMPSQLKRMTLSACQPVWIKRGERFPRDSDRLVPRQSDLVHFMRSYTIQ